MPTICFEGCARVGDDLWRKIIFFNCVDEYERHLQHFELVCIDIILSVNNLGNTTTTTTTNQ